MKIGLYQGPSPAGDCKSALAVVDRMLASAANAGARMLLFPELFLPGYNQPGLQKTLGQPAGGDWEQAFARMCNQHGCGLTIGWAERDGDNLFNAASAFDDSGEKLAHYRKVQLYGQVEQQTFSPGDAFSTFEFENYRVALLICYDVEFSRHVQALATEGVELLLVPTANPAQFPHVHRALVPARAAEAGLTIAYANLCGVEKNLTTHSGLPAGAVVAYGGGSLVVGPDAIPLVTAGVGEVLLITDLSAVSEIDDSIISTQQHDYRDI